jgi:hypothetical protein
MIKTLERDLNELHKPYAGMIETKIAEAPQGTVVFNLESKYYEVYDHEGELVADYTDINEAITHFESLGSEAEYKANDKWAVEPIQD